MELTVRATERPPVARDAPSSVPETDRELDCTIQGGDLAPRVARSIFGAYVNHLSERRTRDAELLLSELVGNSVRHAGIGTDETIEVRLSVSPSTVRVMVSDHGAGFEPPADVAEAEVDRIGGRGLFLVGKLSDRWGVRHDGAMRVWFEMAT